MPTASHIKGVPISSSDVSSFTTQLASISATVSSHTSSIAAHAGTLATLESEVAALEGASTSHGSQLSGQATSISTLTSDLAALTATVGGHTTQLKKLPGSTTQQTITTSGTTTNLTFTDYETVVNSDGSGTTRSINVGDPTSRPIGTRKLVRFGTRVNANDKISVADASTRLLVADGSAASALQMSNSGDWFLIEARGNKWQIIGTNAAVTPGTPATGGGGGSGGGTTPPPSGGGGTGGSQVPGSTWSDEFDGTLSIGDTAASKWTWRFQAWNVNALYGNSDDFFKMIDSASYDGGPTVAAALAATGLWGAAPYLHEIEGGVLKMRAYPAPPALSASIWGYPYVAAMISTELSYSQAYGDWEIKVRWPNISKGCHLAAWLLQAPVNGSMPWPPEVDIFETIGGTDINGNGQFIAYNAIDVTTQDFEFLGAAEYDGWHTFKLTVNQNNIIWYRNGVEKKRIPYYLGGKPMIFLLTMEGASNWAGDPDGTTVWPQEVEVDYVRITKA